MCEEVEVQVVILPMFRNAELKHEDLKREC